MYWRQVVSQSPTTADADQSEIDHYLSVWEPLNQRILTGSSFSGNERNCCFLNTRKPRFADVSGASGLHNIDDSRSIAVTDWDHDGDLDIWMTNRTSPRIRFLRNDTPTKNNYVAFQLDGLPAKNCPRDAYGARVEVTFKDNAGETSTRSQTLHGGDSFLSQSSKSLHFGMGPDESISTVSVRWPGSKEPENFSGASEGTRCLLVQSTGVAKTIPVKKRENVLTPSDLASVPVRATGRLKISWPKSVGDLTYRNMYDQPIIKKAKSDRSTLYVCWASWCEPCLAELKELSNTRLGDVEVIALNIEQATAGKLGNAPTPAKLTSILDKTGFSGTRGLATIELLGTLNQAHLDAIYVRTDLPLPVSFLVDPDGKLRVVYKGKLDVAQVAKDVQQLDAIGRNSMELAIPFPGRWSEEVFDGNPLAVARTYVEDGAPEDAKQFLQHYMEISKPKEGASSSEPVDPAFHPQVRAAAMVELAKMAFNDKNPSEGIALCKESLKLTPNAVPAMLVLISHFANTGEYAAAEPYCRQLEKIAAGHPAVEFQLGNIAMGRKDFGGAIKHYQATIDANPKMVVAANNLAWILATNPEQSFRDGKAAVAAAKLACEATGYQDYRFYSTMAAAYAEDQQFDEAIKVTKKAIEMATEKGDDATVKKSKERLELYESGKPLRQ